MEGHAYRCLLAVSCAVVGVVLSQTDLPVNAGPADPTSFSRYMLIKEFKFGKLQPDALNSDSMLVIRPAAVARLTVDGADYSSETIVGADGQKDIVDATGTEARFNYLFDLVQITDQKIWIASELTYNCLRKIDAETLEVTTFSGTCDAKPADQTYVGAVSETKWTLPGLMTYLESDKKLYIASNGGLRAIDMASLRVEVVEQVIGTIYDMILTSSNTLLMLHHEEIKELNASDSSNPVTRWRKADAPSELQFGFVFDMARIDDDRYFIVDDQEGISLLNIVTGELSAVCPEGSLTLTGGTTEECYDEPSAILHISYIYNNLHIASYWKTTDLDSKFEMGIFFSSESMPPNGSAKIVIYPEDKIVSQSDNKSSSIFPVETTEFNATLTNLTDESVIEQTTPSLNTTEAENFTETVSVSLPTFESTENVTRSAEITTLNTTAVDVMGVNATSLNETMDETVTTASNGIEMETMTNDTQTTNTYDTAFTHDDMEFKKETTRLPENTPTTSKTSLLFTVTTTKYPEVKTPEIVTKSETKKSDKADAGSSTSSATEVIAKFFHWGLGMAAVWIVRHI